MIITVVIVCSFSFYSILFLLWKPQFELLSAGQTKVTLIEILDAAFVKKFDLLPKIYYLDGSPGIISVRQLIKEFGPSSVLILEYNSNCSVESCMARVIYML